ncbi:DUF86 domain-containing protein [Falsibacillus pallidus]|uniref:Uncharacterized protein YutE (UPF0331/DUF86 family) n=1 Tax=Falsibacillus pallidus TaxID=493781 RepID=A0A370GED1_9BACI|nr:DUF86 domain-containing protein [Falsibacillus pallidus]RDI41459.1 uncharacterized protein YutE (UPF0331/DUF86 family) [Falsibacillus pallidus]
MYFVDREHIEHTLIYMEKQLGLFEQVKNSSSEIEKAAFERAAHTIIECILDAGNSMIDGFIMRDPGSYEDIVDILEDEKVITKDMQDGLVKVVGCRKMLVQQYTDMDHEKVERIFTKEFSSLQNFADCVRSYLTNELGPVSAFKN